MKIGFQMKAEMTMVLQENFNDSLKHRFRKFDIRDPTVTHLKSTYWSGNIKCFKVSNLRNRCFRLSLKYNNPNSPSSG